jgi:predicted Fe-S protein YdhL (DUF1289 family)
MSEEKISQVEKPIRSPCISVCTLDEEDVCVGCYRQLDEITGWAAMNRDERLECLKRCNQRSQARNGRWM